MLADTGSGRLGTDHASRLGVRLSLHAHLHQLHRARGAISCCQADQRRVLVVAGRNGSAGRYLCHGNVENGAPAGRGATTSTEARHAIAGVGGNHFSIGNSGSNTPAAEANRPRRLNRRFESRHAILLRTMTWLLEHARAGSSENQRICETGLLSGNVAPIFGRMHYANNPSRSLGAPK